MCLPRVGTNLSPSVCRRSSMPTASSVCPSTVVHLAMCYICIVFDYIYLLNLKYGSFMLHRPWIDRLIGVTLVTALPPPANPAAARCKTRCKKMQRNHEIAAASHYPYYSAFNHRISKSPSHDNKSTAQLEGWESQSSILDIAPQASRVRLSAGA